MDREVERSDATQPAISSMRGLQVLRRQRESGEKLHSRQPFPVDAYRRWTAQTYEYVTEIFGAESDYSSLLEVEPNTAAPPPTDAQEQAARQRARLAQQLEQLDRLMKLLETEVAFVAAEPGASERTRAGTDVILVHGYEPTRRETVIQFLEAYGLNVHTVPTQLDAPATVINAFVEYTDIRFAIVLVAVEEVGARIRPRPDAVLDLGFLLGRLGRKRVCALTPEGVELPGVEAGILCIPWDDNEEWQHRLLAELQAAGAAVTTDTV